MNGGGGNPDLDQLMALAAMQQGGGGGAPGPMPPGGGGPPGGGMPPGMGPQMIPPGVNPQTPQMPGQPQQPKPQDMIQAGLLALHVGMAQMGLTETSMKIIHLVKGAIERLEKMMPEGREGAVRQGSLPSAAPPGVGGMPGMPML